MKNWRGGLSASFACLLMLSGVLTVMISVMYSVSYSVAYLWKLPLAIPMFALGVWLMKMIDSEKK